MRFIEYYEEKLNGQLDIVLGSSNYIPCDGRRNINSCHNHARNNIRRFFTESKCKSIKAYKIVCGDSLLHDLRPITELCYL